MDQQDNMADFKALQIKLASPAEIKSWSHGEVTKSETINYRTLKSEKDGLFCERIFGPTHDWECYCGKYKRRRYEGVICDKCGVEVTRSRVRRERMGHIKLAAPCGHVWYFKGSISPISILLGVSNKYLQKVIYFIHYLVVDVDEKGRNRVLSNLGREEKKELDKIEIQKKQEVRKVNREGKKQEKEMGEKIKNKETRMLAQVELKLQIKRKVRQMVSKKDQQKEATEELYKFLSERVKKISFCSFLSEDEFSALREYSAVSFFKAEMGAEAVLKAIEKVDLVKKLRELRRQVTRTKSKSKIKKFHQRICLLSDLLGAEIDPAWMILRILPVLPPDLRPMVQLTGGKFATSDLNDLYRRVINRNNRLKNLIEIGAPEIILRNEKRMLQEAVDNLIDTSQIRRQRQVRRPLRSLSEMLHGKKGRFRQNLLGKRVDYSGRSVIVVGPKLRLNQCGLPKEIALEIFKPYILRQIILDDLAPNIRSAKTILEKRPPEVFDILEKVTADRLVLLNRAPTLHKLSIQAFYPVLVDGLAIQLHPCVCSGFNADFDGDQMAVHLPISTDAQKEAKDFMTPSSNLLKPSDGSPVTVPTSKEMALGVYYLTCPDSKLPKKESVLDQDEAILAYQEEKIELRQLINVLIKGKVLETTVGRIIFNQVLPPSVRFINDSMNSKLLKSMLAQLWEKEKKELVTEVIDRIKDLGFWGGTVSGLSFSIADNIMHPQKDKIIGAAEKRVLKVEKSFDQGLVTTEEKQRLVQQIWIDTTEELADKTWQLFDITSPVRLIIDAKVSRASRDQVKQLSAMRGLLVDPLGKIVPLPTKSNFREGLAVFEYVTSARGSRKGLTDTALKTADAGYLTRRLVDTAHDVIVREENCGTKKGIEIRREGPRADKFAVRILGRVLADDVRLGKKIILKRGEIVDEKKLSLIEKNKVNVVLVRSPLTCKTSHGVCAQCYGWNFANREMVKIGTPVGVLAAQSIGEPGTQLTLRTKHKGGVIGVDVTQGLPRVEELFEMRVPKSLVPIAEIDGRIKIQEKNGGYVIEIRSKKERREYYVPLMNTPMVTDGEKVLAGTPLASGSLNVRDVLAIRGIEAAQRYLLDSMQEVYESQGVSINDRHFEVIIRKMSDKVKVKSPGDTHFMVGNFVDLLKFKSANRKVISKGGKPAQGKRTVLGITQTALHTESWLSAASFQETVSVLREASLQGKVDNLLGLKENIIIGRLIPTSKERVTVNEKSLEF